MSSLCNKNACDSRKNLTFIFTNLKLVNDSSKRDSRLLALIFILA